MASPVGSPRDATLRQARRLGLGGVAVAAATTVLYLILLAHEGDPLLNVFSVLLVMAQVAGLGALGGNRRAIAVGATILSLLGLLGLASIGIPLLLAAGLLWATVALLRWSASDEPASGRQASGRPSVRFVQDNPGLRQLCIEP